MSKVLVYDPTTSDQLSKVRGVGRYMQILRENFPDWHFSNQLSVISNQKVDVFINPFFNLLQRPVVTKRIAEHQIAVIHDLIPLKYPGHFPKGIKGTLNVFLNKKALSHYDLIVTDSHASLEDITKILGIDERKIKVIYPCLPRIFANPKSETLSSKQIQNSKLFRASNLEFSILRKGFCLYVGDVTWNKNLVTLAYAVKLADIPCIFVGKAFKKEASKNDPWQREFLEFMRIADGDKRFIFPGFVKDEELIALYKKAVCNILVSRDEGFGLSYLEAASQGCPSVLSLTNVLGEIAQDTALFAKTDAHEDIAQNIKKLFEDYTLRLQLGNAAKKRSVFFTTENFRNSFIRLIDSSFNG